MKKRTDSVSLGTVGALLALAPFGHAQVGLAADHAGGDGPRNVAILVFEGVELLDFAGPGEVFAASGRAAFRVFTVAETLDVVRSMGFVDVVPGFTLETCPEPDVVVVPGGSVPSGNESLQAWVRARAERAEIVMSVCNGASLLARAGLLAGLDVTTHRSAMPGVASSEPSARVLTNRRFVDNGSVITTAGISAGIDGSLHVVARLLGEEAARATARFMEYDWRPEEIAALHRQEAVVFGARSAALLERLRTEGVGATLARPMDPAEGVEHESELNAFAYQLVATGRGEDALELLRYVLRANPTSANAADSLAEVLETTGHVAEALRYARHTLSLLPEDGSLTTSLRARLRGLASGRVERLTSLGDGSPTFACTPCGQACDEGRQERGGACSACGMPMRVSAAVTD